MATDMTNNGKTGSQSDLVKDLYDIDEIPPLRHVPARMHAWAIRKGRHGPPEGSMKLEVVPN